MLNVKKGILKLISDIYECQKRITINRRFIQDLVLEGREHYTSGLQNEIVCLQVKIIEFRKELRERY